MDTFIWGPLIRSQGETAFRVLSAKFGDGYEQMAADGLHGDPQTWPLEFVGRGAEIMPIKVFLDNHAGWKAFLWTPPLASQPRAFVAEGYRLVPAGADIYTLSATFREVFKP